MANKPIARYDVYPVGKPCSPDECGVDLFMLNGSIYQYEGCTWDRQYFSATDQRWRYLDEGVIVQPVRFERVELEDTPTVEHQAAEFLRQFPWRRQGEDIEPTELSIRADLGGLSQYEWALISCYPEKHGMTDKQALPLLRKQAERDPENRMYKAWLMRAATGILGKEIVNMVEAKEDAT